MNLTERKLGRLRPWAWGPDSVELLEPLFANLTGEKRTASQSFNPSIAQLYSKAWSASFLRKVLADIGRAGSPLPAASRGQTPERRARSETVSKLSDFFLSPRGTSGERTEERGILNKNAPPLPGPLLHFVEEREKASLPVVLRQSRSDAPYLCTPDEVGVAVETLDDALEAIAAIRRRGHHKVVVKQALGLAGGNAIRLFEPELLETHRRWMANAVENHRQLVVEPWLERVLDFSVQLEMTADGLKLCGYTGLLNDARGQFRGNWAAPKFERRIPANVIELFHEPPAFAGPKLGEDETCSVARTHCVLSPNWATARRRPDIATRLHALYADIFSLLEAELQRAGFLGPVGIDAFVYRTPQGDCRLKPIVEINPRYTMGRLTVELMKQVAPGSHGWFRLVSRAMTRAGGFDDFPAYARSLSERFPLRLEGEPSPRIREGAICLNDPAQAQVCLAVFQVARGPSVPGLTKIWLSLSPPLG